MRCLATVFSYFGLRLSLQSCKELVKTDMQGSSIFGIVSGAEAKGLNAEAYTGDYNELLGAIEQKEISLPFVVHIITEENFEHFIVITKIKTNAIQVFDPGCGSKNMSIQEFLSCWTGHVITFERTERFVPCNAAKGAYAKYVSLLFSRKKLICLTLLASMAGVLISLVGSFSYEVAIDRFILANEAGAKEPFEQIEYLMAVLIGLYLLQSVIQMARGMMLALISKSIDIKLMHSYIDKIHRLPMSFHHSMRAGELLSRFTDINEIRAVMSGAAITIMFDALSFLGGALLMFVISRPLFWMVMVIAVFYAVVFLAFQPAISKINNSVMAANARAVSDIKESVEGIETIKLNQAEGLFSSEIKKRQKHWQRKRTTGKSFIPYKILLSV